MVNKLFGAKPFVRELCFINSKRYCSGSNHRRCSVKKYVLESFANFTGKHLCWSFLSIKLQASDCNFTKKETLVQVFFYKILDKTGIVLEEVSVYTGKKILRPSN